MKVTRTTYLKPGELPPTLVSRKNLVISDGDVLLEEFVVDLERVVITTPDQFHFTVLVDGVDCGGWTRVEWGTKALYDAVGRENKPTALPTEARLYLC